MLDRIKEKDNKEHLARTLAGYAWPWLSKKRKDVQPKDFDIEIGPIKLKWNSVNKDWINSANAINEVGCIHTVQGYDLNYAGIIFGHEIGYDKERKEIFIREEKYFDRNGKIGIKDPGQLKRFILNIYKTMMLRGIKGTYIYVCDEPLREYFSKHIQLYVDEQAMVKTELQPEPFVNCVPLYDLSAAAGEFSEQQSVTDEVQWYPVNKGTPISKEHFACKVIGNSMNKMIPTGAICLFRKYSGGTRNGDIVLASLTDRQDHDFGSNYTVKRYKSKKKDSADGGWEHIEIILEPASTDPFYQNIVLKGDELVYMKVIGIFERVLS